MHVPLTVRKHGIKNRPTAINYKGKQFNLTKIFIFSEMPQLYTFCPTNLCKYCIYKSCPRNQKTQMKSCEGQKKSRKNYKNINLSSLIQFRLFRKGRWEFYNESKKQKAFHYSRSQLLTNNGHKSSNKPSFQFREPISKSAAPNLPQLPTYTNNLIAISVEFCKYLIHS